MVNQTKINEYILIFSKFVKVKPGFDTNELQKEVDRLWAGLNLEERAVAQTAMEPHYRKLRGMNP